MKIAVIGSGISGLSAAWLLSEKHQVSVFEKEDWLGGHTHTVSIKTKGQDIPVDTGFMVFNPPRYPQLTALFDTLSIESIPTSMRFAVSMEAGGFEWSSDIPTGIFADKRNFLRLSYWAFLFGILRFNKIARRELKIGISPDETLEIFLTRHFVSDAVRFKYVYPLAGAIWSTPVVGTKLSPALAILSFLDNHHLLNASVGRFKWRTVAGGSKTYVQKIKGELDARGAALYLQTTVESVRREGQQVTIKTSRGDERFDYCVIATHADTALRLLADADDTEREVLSAFAYEANEVFLHGDISCMPHRRRAWAAWNYLGETRGVDGLEKVSLTYYMNELQHIRADTPVFVTLNPHQAPDPRLMYGKFIYHHPIYTPGSIRAQKKLDSIQNKRQTLFCGSYFGYGFHEDGLCAGIAVAKHFGITPPWEKEAAPKKG